MAVTISWTHSWSSSDDGTVLYGADLGAVQTDIEAHTHSEYMTSLSIYNYDEKIIISDNDIVLIEDSEASYAKKKTKKSNLVSTVAVDNTTIEFNGLNQLRTKSDITIKGWINFNGTGTIAIQDSYNVTSITDNGTGNYTVTWDTDFANDDYTIGLGCSALIITGTIAIGTVAVETYVSIWGAVDAAFVSLIAIGDQ